MTDICNCQAVTQQTLVAHRSRGIFCVRKILRGDKINKRPGRGEDTRVTGQWRHYLAIHQTHVCIIDWRDTSVMCGLIIITHYTLSRGLNIALRIQKYSKQWIVMFM